MNQNLLKILSENPDLPILCMVDYEICGDDSCRRWAGSIGEVEIKEYISLDPEETVYGQSIFWKEDIDELIDLMSEEAPPEEYEAVWQQNAEKIKKDERWIKAIVINIDTP